MFPIRDTIPSRTFPYVTIALIFINSLIFLYEVSLGPYLDTFIRTYGLIPQQFYASAQQGAGGVLGRYLPLFTSMFLHGGWFHIIGNMWYLWIFGDNVEDRLGHGRFFLFYILCGLAAGFTHLWFNPSSTVPTVGASGAIAGVMGAYFLLFPTSRIITLVFIIFFIEIIEIPAFFYLGIWFLMQFINGAATLSLTHQGGGVAWWAHFGGFVAGAILVPFLKKPKRKLSRVYHDHYFRW